MMPTRCHYSPLGEADLADVLRNPGFLIAVAAVVIAVAVGFSLILWVRNWRQRLDSAPGPAVDQLPSYRALLEKGELSQEEYDNILRTLGLTDPAPRQTDSQQP